MAVNTLAAGNGTLGRDDFLTLLVAQVKNQDPLEPVKDTDFIAQLAQFSTLQGIEALNANFEQELQLQQLTGGAALLGRTVKYAGPDGAASGAVGGVLVQDGKIVLDVGGAAVPLDAVRAVLPA